MADRGELFISGAGPAGCLAATLFAEDGFTCSVFDKRPDPRGRALTAGRSINLAVSDRGKQALRAVGLEQRLIDESVKMSGRLVHKIGEPVSFQPYGVANEHNCSVSRAGLNLMLLEKAVASEKVKFRFGHTVQGMNFETGELDVLVGGQRQLNIPTTQVIGADGSASAIRTAMQENLGVEVKTTHLLHGYKELAMPSCNGDFAMRSDGLHIWPRGNLMLIALPNIDKTFTCTLFLKNEADRIGDFSFASLADRGKLSPDRINEFFSIAFPDVQKLIPDLAYQFQHNPVGHLETTYASRWYTDRSILVGDGAHPMVPFLGQGLNCALQDVYLYVSTLRELDYDFPAANERFFNQRSRDVEALQYLCVKNFKEMSADVADPRFMAMKSLLHELEEKHPDRFRSAYGRITYSTGSYYEAMKFGEISEKIAYAAIDKALEQQANKMRLLDVSTIALEPILVAIEREWDLARHKDIPIPRLEAAREIHRQP